MASLPPPSVRRWRRFGHDRLYLTAADGTALGWYDLHTDSSHPSHPEHSGAMATAVAAWRSTGTPGHAGTADMVASASAPDCDDAGAGEVSSQPAVVDSEFVDLAENPAGAAARARATALREARPVRTFLARCLGLHTDERAWRIGADGEEKVAAQLARLTRKDPRWRVLHAVPVGSRGSDIDHVVIGPAGVFTVNTKHHPGARIWVAGNTFLVDGRRAPYLRNSRHEASRAARLLERAGAGRLAVEGVVVLVNADSIRIKHRPEGVAVVPRRRLVRWLRRRPEILDPGSCGWVFEVARRSTTWSG